MRVGEAKSDQEGTLLGGWQGQGSGECGKGETRGGKAGTAGLEQAQRPETPDVSGDRASQRTEQRRPHTDPGLSPRGPEQESHLT